MAKLFGKVDAKEIKRRSSILLETDKQLQEAFRKSCIGLNEKVLVEHLRPLRGRCARYFTVNLAAHPDAKNLREGDITNIVIEPSA